MVLDPMQKIHQMKQAKRRRKTRDYSESLLETDQGGHQGYQRGIDVSWVLWQYFAVDQARTTIK